MKRVFTAVLFLIAASSFATDKGFDYKTPIKNIKGVVKKLNEDLTVIKVAGKSSKQYVGSNLPKELNIDGLAITFCGLEAAIPPYIRMAGTPVKFTCIKISSKDQKAHQLTKRKFKPE